MPRRKGLQVAVLPTGIIQRGNNRQACFFAEDDYQFFLDHLEKMESDPICRSSFIISPNLPSESSAKCMHTS